MSALILARFSKLALGFVFYDPGATLIGTATSAPYTVTWSNVGAGTYSLTAKATDNRGQGTTSAAVSIYVDVPPSIALSSPLANATFTAPASIALAAAAADSDGTVAKVDFYQGTTLIGTATTAPYTLNWTDVPLGNYTLTARATDNRGVVTTSSPVGITVQAGGTKIYYLHTDHLDTLRLVTDEQNRIVWRNQPLSEPFGNSPPEEDPDGNGQAFVLNLRAPGQYYDRESGTHYNYFRDYDPTTGRYLQSDPIGLRGGINTYSYVNGNPLGYIDSLGLFTVVERGFPQQEAALRQMGERLQAKINNLCPKAKKKLQPLFDRWVVSVDPKVDALIRNRSDYALSDPQNKSTTFYSGFFGLHPYLRQGRDPGQSFVGAHELRHLMPENNDLSPGAAYVGSLLEGKAGSLPIEKDADAFASKLIAGECSCAD